MKSNDKSRADRSSEPENTQTEPPLLDVRDLTVVFDIERGSVPASNHNSFTIEQGETVGLVGESGSGKSVTARAILNLIKNSAIKDGKILFKGNNLLNFSPEKMRTIRGNEISMIFQDPMSGLNPSFTVGQQIRRVLRIHDKSTDQSSIQRWLNTLPGISNETNDINEKAIKLLDQVNIPDPADRIDEYPHQFSGGMRQRVLIAMAIASEPDLLIADEPTTALDVTIEAKIFELLKDLQKEVDMSLLLITHDLSVVADTCDRALVMYASNIVEKGDILDLYDDPLHPYTEGLFNLIPRADIQNQELNPIEGNVPDLTNIPSGCPFRPRCPYAVESCADIEPELQETKPDREVACIEVEGYEI